ncbi:MAG: ACP S-malonyltransferase, partial [Burkholderiales bacterium PBB4]
MSYAALFSGQGTQRPGMLPWLEVEPACHSALQAMQGIIGSDWRATLADDAERSSNVFAQPLLVGTGLAAWSALALQLQEPPAVVAGYSVAELSAFACAGVFSVSDAMALARQRAADMDAAVLGMAGGLLAVSGMSRDAVLQACPTMACAIDVAADQAIYAGPADVLRICALDLAMRGAVCTQLEVRVASHSHWMSGAALQFEQTLKVLPFNKAKVAIALNATGTTTTHPNTLRRALSAQIATTVQWAACMDAIAERGVRCVIEIGTGATLSKMWNQRYPGIPARSINDF